MTPQAWDLLITPKAERDLQQLPQQDQTRISRELELVASSGLAGHDIRKLRAHDNEWRIRVGSWRIRFRVDFANRRLVVLRILHRSRAYRD